MFDKKCQPRTCGACKPMLGGMSGMIPTLLHGAVLAVGMISIARFVYKKLKRCDGDRLGKDLKNCKDDIVAFAQDACDEVCDCMSDCDCDDLGRT